MTKEILENEIKRIDYINTEPQILKKLIEDSLTKGELFSKKIERVHGISDIILQNQKFINRLRHRDIDKNLCISSCAGLDGSTVNTGLRGIAQFQCCSIACIIFQNYFDKVVPLYDAKILEIEDSAPEVMEKEITKNMMEFETQNLFDSSNKLKEYAFNPKNQYINFLDGPIIDPPGEKEIDYVKSRCASLMNAIENNTTTIGVVKRFHENFFIKFLAKNNPNISMQDLQEFNNDSIIASSIFSSINQNQDESIYTDIFEYDINSEVYQTYLEYGIKIFSFLFSYNLKSKIYRVDFCMKSNSTEEEIYNTWNTIVHNLIKWTYTGNSLPFPVLFAHEKCTLKNAVSEVLFQEYISKSTRLNGKNILTFSKLGAN